jgi:nucleotide-binding universal stress UspA family protein
MTGSVGPALALGIVAMVGGTMYWMLHPPKTKADVAARKAERELVAMVGSIIVVFSGAIASEHMMVLAARLARREKAELLAAYVIEVPRTLPPNASMPDEERAALGALATAHAIAEANGVQIRAETIKGRLIHEAVLSLAKQRDAQLIIMGSYREGKYAGAPLSREIEAIAANAACDVLIGVRGRHGHLLERRPEAAAPAVEGGT